MKKFFLLYFLFFPTFVFADKIDMKIDIIVDKNISVSWNSFTWASYYKLFYWSESSNNNPSFQYQIESKKIFWTWYILESLDENKDYYLSTIPYDINWNPIILDNYDEFIVNTNMTEFNKTNQNTWTTINELYWSWYTWSILAEDVWSKANSFTWESNSWFLIESKKELNTIKEVRKIPLNDNDSTIKELPRTWPQNYIIILLAFLLGFVLFIYKSKYVKKNI